MAPARETNNNERFFNITSVRSRGCMHWYRLQQSGFKSTPDVLPCLTIQVLVEDAMYVSQGGMPISTEGMLSISGDRGFRSYLTV